MTAAYDPWNIRLQDLRIGYPGLVVLDGINAELPAGKITVILGGSGCGKSTLLKHVLGLNKPMQGKIFVGEHDLFSLKSRQFHQVRRRMGVLFQDGALLGSLTLGENVGLPLREHTRLPKKTVEEIVRYKLSLVGLEKFYGYYPSQLSGGMRKRAGLARGIVMDPPILLCDEPTSGLDPINSAQMDQLLVEMNRRDNVTTVVVSHDLESLFAIADHAIILHDGKALYTGDLDGLKNTNDPYLRRFLERKPDEQDMPENVGRREDIERILREHTGY